MTTVASRPDVARASAAPASPLPFTERTRCRIGLAVLAVMAYVPILLTHRGKVEADTKSYLYLDPGRLLAQALSMWDPKIGMGTVTHQTVGYLFPMGPFYWVLEQALGLPSWVAQRLWLGTLLFGAGLGMWFLLRTLRMRGPGVPVGVLAYAFTPYVLQYSARFSVILGPWAALPWMIAIVARGLRRGGWKYPALFAITVQLVGGVNATALVFSGIGPLLWIPYAVWGLREATWRRAWQVVWRTGLLTLLTSLWWMAGLWAQGNYGLDILKFTETVQTVSVTSYANEILRGLGYWFFYFRDLVGPWNDAVLALTQHRWEILVGYAVPAIAFLAAVVVRWRPRIFFVLLVLVGVTIAVGASPYDDPSALGSLFKAFAASSSAGLALRSTGRAVPLVALGLAGLLAAGVSALADALATRGRALVGIAVAGLVGLLLVLNFPGLWDGALYSQYLERDEAVPRYWQRALRDVNRQPHDTRVLALPGSDFAAYRWGVTIDPIEPGLIDRPYVARELVPWGSPASASLLEALDRRVQSGDLEPAALAPMARIMGVGDVLLRLDLQTERYNLIRSARLWNLFIPTPPGFDAPRTYGTEIPGKPALDRIDEEVIADASRPPVSPPPVVVYRVRDPLPIVRATRTAAPLIVAGDADGIVDAASVGLVGRDSAVLYSGSYAENPAALRAQIAQGATLVVTDTNRRRSHRWTGAQDNSGHTEQVGEQTLVKDARDARLDLFPGSTASAQTVVERGGPRVEASGYGLAGLSPQPAFRPARALDGDPRTSWQVGGETNDVVGQRIRVGLEHPITTDRVRLLQPIQGPRGRWITDATLTFDGGDPVKVRLGPESRAEAGGGQDVRFARRSFATFELRVDDIHEIPPSQWKLSPRVDDSVRSLASNIGLAEIGLRDDRPGAPPVRVDDVVRMPTDLLRVAGAGSLDHPLVLTMTRDGRAVDAKTDSELALRRSFSLPTARGFDLSGTARVNTGAADDLVDTVLGIPGAAAGGVTATSSDRMFGDLAARASSAIDGDPSTAWTTPVGDVPGQWVKVTTTEPVTLDRLDLRIANDRLHSVPTRIEIASDDGTTRVVDVPAVETTTGDTSTTVVPVNFAPITGRSFTFTVDDVRSVVALDYATLRPGVMPVGIADLGIPGVTRPVAPSALAGACRDDLVAVDGRPVPVRVTGSTESASANGALALERCGAALALGPGHHVLDSARGLDTGIDLDRIVLSSASGGSAAPVADTAPAATIERQGGSNGAPPAPPRARVLAQANTSATVRIDRTTEPVWLVLGQSQNAGWTAKVGGRDVGESKLVDGYANGWLVKPTRSGGPVTVELEWTPERNVDRAVLASLLAVAACIGIVIVAGVRSRRRFRAGVVAPDAGVVLPIGTQPLLANPLVARGAAPGAVTVVVTAVLAGGAAALLVRPWCGLVVAGLVALALARPRWRGLLSISPAVAVGLCGIYVTLGQLRNRYLIDIRWPTHFWPVRNLAWLAVLLLAADALVGLVRRAEPAEASEARGSIAEPPQP